MAHELPQSPRGSTLRLPLLGQIIRLYLIDVAMKVWQRLRLASPLTIRVELQGACDYKVMAESP